MTGGPMRIKDFPNEISHPKRITEADMKVSTPKAVVEIKEPGARFGDGEPPNGGGILKGYEKEPFDWRKLALVLLAVLGGFSAGACITLIFVNLWAIGPDHLHDALAGSAFLSGCVSVVSWFIFAFMAMDI